MAEGGGKTAETPRLREWAALHHLMLQIPAKFQNLLVTGDLQLTSVSAVEQHILLGTNTGSVYWYDSDSCSMERYRRELSLFLVPRLARGDVPEYVRITESNMKKRLQFGVQGEHRAPVSALCWSQNAARLFSGDEAGAVVVTEIDYVAEAVTSRVVMTEPAPVVQLQYSRQTLLVATRARSCLLKWPDGQPCQVGSKPRKSPADLGACFVEEEGGVSVLAARPSLKVVTAGLDGRVLSTVSLRPTLETCEPVELLYPVGENLKLANGDLSLDEVMQDLRSAVPVAQVRTLISSVTGQLDKVGLFDALSSKAEAVSSLTSRVGSLATAAEHVPPGSDRGQTGPRQFSEPPCERPRPDEPATDQRRQADEQRTTGHPEDERRRTGERPDSEPVVDEAPIAEVSAEKAAGEGRQTEERPLSERRSEEGGLAPVPSGPLDFTQFYPSEVRPSLHKSDSVLEEERRDKERRLAVLLGLDDLSPPAPAPSSPPPPPPPPPLSVGSSSSPSPPSPGVGHYRDLFGIAAAAAAAAEDARDDSAADGPRRGEQSPPAAPSFHSLFAFGEKAAEVAPPPPPAPPRPASADSETGEPRRAAAIVRPASPQESELGPTPEPESESESAPADWRPWDRQLAPSFVMTLAACCSYVVVTDPDGRVFCSPAGGPAAWEQLDYTACQVSVSCDGRRVWRLDAAGVAYALADPEPDRPRGSHWVRAARDVLQLAADSTAVWYIKRGGKLFVQRDLSAHRCASPEHAVDAPDQIIHVGRQTGRGMGRHRQRRPALAGGRQPVC
ncbi:uncharacterized protein LOC119094588 [Pollicipes pollicipes]|uniref:uncharacterized protein LOC119094588 n=1 Tax=Pollicipes pollicipes TaxID=41117 RepID=UPI0018851B89|nr:uncharacterized protein LOC119094588 [Pollicipes pollicipes]